MGGQQPATPIGSPAWQVSVFELVSTGYFGDRISESFRCEGRAMLDAALADFRCIPGVTADFSHAAAGESSSGTLKQAALVIAPEFDSLLERFIAEFQRPGVTSLNCDPQAVALAADKWRFFEHLGAQDIPTIHTDLLCVEHDPAIFPCLVKPRFGAGSWLVRQVNQLPDWPRVCNDYRAAGLEEALFQPVIAGTACSAAALLRPGQPPDLFPIAEQRLSCDGEFRYLGGMIPAKLSLEATQSVQHLVQRTLASVPGLNGYIGCDVIIPDDSPHRPVLVELNPRLTTSYIGYRELCETNLMQRLLLSPGSSAALQWKTGRVLFDSHGNCRYDDA